MARKLSLCDEFLRVQSGIATLCRVGSGSEAVLAELDLYRHVTLMEHLSVSIAHDEGTSFYLLIIHVVDSVASAATDTDHLDDRIAAYPVSRGYVHILHHT